MKNMCGRIHTAHSSTHIVYINITHNVYTSNTPGFFDLPRNAGGKL